MNWMDRFKLWVLHKVFKWFGFLTLGRGIGQLQKMDTGNYTFVGIVRELKRKPNNELDVWVVPLYDFLLDSIHCYKCNTSWRGCTCDEADRHVPEENA